MLKRHVAGGGDGDEVDDTLLAVGCIGDGGGVKDCEVEEASSQQRRKRKTNMMGDAHKYRCLELTRTVKNTAPSISNPLVMKVVVPVGDVVDRSGEAQAYTMCAVGNNDV
jgi:hypothetical protein